MPNPPDGVSINYYLKSAASSPVLLEVFGADGRLVRRYSSEDPVSAIPAPEAAAVPLYWYKPPQRLATTAGLHRWIWDVHYQPLSGGGGGGRGGLPISSVPGLGTSAVGTPWVGPGTYTVKLTVNGKSYSQSIIVKQDPRVKTPSTIMQQVYANTKAVYDAAVDVQAAGAQVASLRAQIATLKPQASGAAATALTSFDEKLAALQAAPGGARRTTPGGDEAGAEARQPGGRGGAPQTPALPVLATLTGAMNSLQGADVQPTANQLAAIRTARGEADSVLARWTALRTTGLTTVNTTLKSAGLGPLEVR